MIHVAKKSMGQNFLKSEPALRMMCDAGMVTDTDTVVEIGPGKGALTSKLLEKAGTVVAIEKDHDLITLLEERFKNEIQNKKLVLIHDDVLRFDPQIYKLKSGHYKIIANIPYNITGAIIKRFLQETVQPSTMVLLLQKEVAERIVVRDNKESILSLSVKIYGDVAYMMKVGKRFFSPSPKVDSAIIAITNISKQHLKTEKEELAFFSLVKAAFSHKRKVVRKNLESILPMSSIEEIMRELSIDGKARAEDIPFKKWVLIHNLVQRG